MKTQRKHAALSIIAALAISNLAVRSQAGGHASWEKAPAEAGRVGAKDRVPLGDGGMRLPLEPEILGSAVELPPEETALIEVASFGATTEKTIDPADPLRGEGPGRTAQQTAVETLTAGAAAIGEAADARKPEEVKALFGEQTLGFGPVTALPPGAAAEAAGPKPRANRGIPEDRKPVYLLESAKAKGEYLYVDASKREPDNYLAFSIYFGRKGSFAKVNITRANSIRSSDGMGIALVSSRGTLYALRNARGMVYKWNDQEFTALPLDEATVSQLGIYGAAADGI